tara:strand:+ start:7988 stop:9184 length:1197 start_codon:yes stop_codon:yes gene_type:complete
MNKIKLTVIPVILSCFIIYLSLNLELWLNFWRTLNIPSVIPPFSDLDSILKTNLSKNAGFNVYLENPYDPSHGVYMYPSIWLNIFSFLKLNKPSNFMIFNFTIIFIYFYIIQDLIVKNYSRISNFLFIIFFFSTTNFLILERLNIEIVVFSLIYFAVISNKNIFKFSFFLIALFCKVFPIFSIFILTDKKIFFYSALFLSILYLIINKEEIYYMSINMIEYARIFAYGSGSIAKSIYYYSREYNLFIDDSNYIYLKLFIIFLFMILAFLLFKKNFLFGDKKIDENMTLNERFFLAGGGVYLGTFIFSANVDYRLVFLLFTFSYILRTNNNLIKYIYFISCSIIFNSFIFEGGDPYSILYFIKAGFIYSLKFVVFVIVCYFFGMVCNKYLILKIKLPKF